jgi:hypothetical protein
MAQQPNVQATRVGAEQQKSNSKNSTDAVSAIYDAINSYNGVVRRIIEMTTPVGGKWSTRKTVDNSTVMYFASVLKGLIEPLKHMIFQLSQVHDPDLASMLTMVTGWYKTIDQSPPFKILDVVAYKQGIPNFEGVSDDLSIYDAAGYIALLENKEKELRDKIYKFNSQLSSSLANVPKEMRNTVKEAANDANKQSNEVLAAIYKEIKEAKKRANAKLDDVVVKGQLLDDQSRVLDALDVYYLNPDKPLEYLKKRNQKLELEEGITRNIDSVTDLKQLEAKKKGIEEAYMLAKGTSDPQQMMTKDKLEYLAIIRNISKIKDASKTGAGSCGSGGSENNKQQYNSMGRPLSDDQKINNDMINANKNWQVKNNPPHDTPIGNLNPFIAQNDASKYTYEVKLAQQNTVIHPETNALGADISLLQGPISTVSGSGKTSKAMMKIKKVAIDEKNDMYAPTEMGSNGFIPEDKENQFKLPDLKPKKKK